MKDLTIRHTIPLSGVLSALALGHLHCQHSVREADGSPIECGQTLPCAEHAHGCDWCQQPMTRPAPDDCANPEHRVTDTTLGLREAGCGCCVIVDATALRLLRGSGGAA